jgi:8-oxo-dGTP pyrophosphatase MutT (NUDIX family)
MRPSGLPATGLQQAAVCLLLYDGRAPAVLAIRKTDTAGYHWRNQIALPGGHVAPDDPTVEHTALRELHEELGIPPDDLQVLGPLGHFQTVTSRRDVAVTVARWLGQGPIHIDRREVAGLVEVPIAALADIHLRHGFAGRPIPQLGDALVYRVRSARIWGLTARILHTFAELLLAHGLVSPAASPSA